MHRILIIEDDSFKAINIRDFLSSLLSDSLIEEVPSLVEAIDRVNEREYDYVIVDMAIPSHRTVQGGGAPMSLLNGGLEVILELDAIGRPNQCIVVTQFHEIEIAGRHYAVRNAAEAIKTEIGCQVLGCIEYSDEDDKWKSELSKLID